MCSYAVSNSTTKLLDEIDDKVWKAVCDHPGLTALGLRNLLERNVIGRNVGVSLRKLVRLRRINKKRWKKKGVVCYYPNQWNLKTQKYLSQKQRRKY